MCPKSSTTTFRLPVRPRRSPTLWSRWRALRALAQPVPDEVVNSGRRVDSALAEGPWPALAPSPESRASPRG